jgi:hypothetical protein
MENLYGSNLELSSDFGDISAIGTLFGDIEININEGNVELDLDMKEEDISYEIENKLGDIKVNFDGMGKDVEMINEKARLRLDISSKLGDVDLDYRL